MNGKKMNLPVKILIGMALGLAVGISVHSFVHTGNFNLQIAVRGFELGGILFLNLFRMIVVPVVLVSMIRGVCSMSNPALLGRVGLKTLIIFAVTTVISALLGIVLSYAFNIGKVEGLVLPKDTHVKLEGSLQSISETLTGIVPSNMFKSVVDANMLQIIVIAVILGLAIAMIQQKVPTLLRLLEELDMLNIKVVELILAVAPYGVFCLLAHTFSSFGPSVLIPLTKYLLVFTFATLILLFVIYPLMLIVFVRISPGAFYRRFAPIMLLAFSTSSSNATLPSNIETLTKEIGVSNHISTFILSLGATINMNGTAIMQGCAAVLIAQLYGVDLSVAQIVQIMAMCMIASIGTAGMPGAGVIMLGLVLESVGLPLAGIALVLGVDRVVDMIRTVANITGDAVTAVIVGASEDSLNRELLKSLCSNFCAKSFLIYYLFFLT